MKFASINFTGTGKSVTGAQLAYASVTLNPNPDGCVMYCGPSNKSVDVVLGKYYREYCAYTSYVLGYMMCIII